MLINVAFGNLEITFFAWLFLIIAVPILHVFHTGLRTSSFGPYNLFGIVAFIYLKIEHIVMRIANYFVTGKWSWFFRSRIRRFIFDEVRMLMTQVITLEPYTIEESKAIVKNIFRDHPNVYLVNRICPCRAATNKILNKDGTPYDDKPIVTDIVFLTKTNGLAHSKGAKGFMRFISIKDVLKLLDKFEQAGLVHAFMGPCPSVYGSAMMTICNCHPEICLPMVWFKKKRFSFFDKGHNKAVIDLDKCTGCGNCIARCPINARKLINGKAVVLDHCFGCGTCRVSCEGQATRMIPSRKAQYYPEYMIRKKDGSFIAS
ncbi:MAG: 4Fe-4S dicluster domain-containing protein [Candidatus Lokiarchaeota archaeon]|nr:4Fe-4S dicluster domain-containing protein [Candidatus Lokiarchaeota archaeon]